MPQVYAFRDFQLQTPFQSVRYAKPVNLSGRHNAVVDVQAWPYTRLYKNTLLRIIYPNKSVRFFHN
jgi:hypothetical protein